MGTTELGRSAGIVPTVSAAEGAGPLVQRDYWAVLDGSRHRPSELVALVRGRFRHIAPPDLARFRNARGIDTPLAVGDDIDVHIRMAGDHRVRVVHSTATSLTLATLPHHPEAGRITFGAYRNIRGDIVFHIRSRARSRSRSRRAGFLVAGDPMQTGTWTDFIDRLAAMLGETIIGAIHAESRVVDEEDEDRRPADAPTFIARGD